MIVSGGTGAGKTTTLNVLSSFIPADERIVTIEDAAELQLKQDHVVRLESRPANIEGKGAVTIRDLVKNSLRMRPDRIIVGEVRDASALDMLQAMNTGHDGSICTLHSNGPRDTLSRMETMVLMAGMDLPIRAIREQVASAVDLVVHQARLKDGSRRITHITEVERMEGDVIALQDIFLYDTSAGFDENGKRHGHAQGHRSPPEVPGEDGDEQRDGRPDDVRDGRPAMTRIATRPGPGRDGAPGGAPSRSPRQRSSRARVIGVGGTAWADDEATIDHLKLDGTSLEVLLTVPGNGEVDLGSRQRADRRQGRRGTAEDAADSDLRRTSVLAFDTSNSMAGAKFTQAKAAALSYLDAVPDNVYVGLVTFDDAVEVAKEPTLDRDQMRAAIGDLKLAESPPSTRACSRPWPPPVTAAPATCWCSPTGSTPPRPRCRPWSTRSRAPRPRWTWSPCSSRARASTR